MPLQEKLDNLYFAYYEVQGDKELNAEKTTTPYEPEPHLFPKDVEEVMAEYKAEVKHQHEEDAKHWTYPISYPTQEEVVHQAELYSEHMAASAKAEAGLPDEHHVIPPEILEKEIQQRQRKKEQQRVGILNQVPHPFFPL